jgi:hypothetical protein
MEYRKTTLPKLISRVAGEENEEPLGTGFFHADQLVEVFDNAY